MMFAFGGVVIAIILAIWLAPWWVALAIGAVLVVVLAIWGEAAPRLNERRARRREEASYAQEAR